MNCVIRKKQRIRRVRGSLFFLTIFVLAVLSYYHMITSIPNELHVASVEDAGKIVLPFERIITEEVTTASAGGDSNIPAGSVHINCSLFGVLPLKTVKVSEQSVRKVIPCGNIVGIFMETEGIMVVGSGRITGIDGVEYEPAMHIIRSGDYITSVNGEDVETKEELIEAVNTSNGENLTLQVLREGEMMSLQLHPVRTEEECYKLGVWVRDDTQGIGTLTYMDAEGNYGALGHGISDLDTGLLMKIRAGELYRASIQSVKKGVSGTPGELAGTIRYQESEKLGTVVKNTETGIYGKLQSRSVLASVQEEARTYYPTAFKQEVKTGNASILCCIDGMVQEYAVEILKINMGNRDVNKGMVLKVTDEELLAETGGIVQGMSGSPILQNGKIVGAVTHVFVNDPAKGYGIFIENMLMQK